MEKVKLSGNYFETSKGPFIVVGVNWVPSREAMQWPYEWNPESMDADFLSMSNLGINFIRFDLVWAWFEPRPGQYNEEAFHQFDYLCSLAHKYEIYLNPAFFIGGEVGDAYWDVPWRNGRHPHTDPEMIKRQADHIAEFGRRYASENAVLAWDLTDEPPFWIVAGDTSDAAASNWTRILCQSLRETDPDHLIVCGTSVQEIMRGPFRADNILKWVDFMSVHPYPIYEPFLYNEPLLSTRMTYSAAYETSLSRGAGKPVLMQEFGATSSMFSPERQGEYYRTMMYSALGAGNQGFIAWCSNDANPQVQFNRAPYKRNPHETQFGITDYQRNPRPNGMEMKNIRAVVDQLTLKDIQQLKEEAGVIVPHEWAHGPDYTQYGFPGNTQYQYSPITILNDKTDSAANARINQAWLSTYILCHQAGISLGFPRELGNWQQYPLLLTPAPLTHTNDYAPYVPFWQQILPWVKEGGSLYGSLSMKSALSIPDVTNLFGASIADRAFYQPEITIKFSEDFYGIQKGEEFKFAASNLELTGVLLKPEGAKPVAYDQNGNPAVVVFANGKGRTALCSHPIEMMLGVTPNAFEQNSEYWKIYRALKRWAGIRSPYEVDSPNVELSLLTGESRDYVVLVNHSPSPEQGDVTFMNEFSSVKIILPEGKKPVKIDSGRLHYNLECFSGVIFEVEKKKNE
jgi:endo-1,4-beta-mannosidase